MVACSVKVIHGANDGFFDVAGATVRSLRGSLVDAFNIPDDAIALANGQRVPGGYELRGNDVLEFVREGGEKGAGKKKATVASPDDDGDKDEDRHDAPDFSVMDLDGLAAFIDGRLASSYEAERRSLLQANKSAVHLFWAGGALFEARAKCEKEGRGKWKEYKEEHGFKDTTANDAIRLFENAKTPEALAGLGVTEAKKKFVYPDQNAPKQKPDDKTPKPTKTKGATGPGKPPSDRKKRNTGIGRKDDAKDAAPKVENDELIVIDPAEAVAEALEEIAQQLNEIAQDDLGKVDFTGQIPTRLTTAIQAVAKGLANITERINHDRSHS